MSECVCVRVDVHACVGLDVCTADNLKYDAHERCTICLKVDGWIVRWLDAWASMCMCVCL